MKEINARYGPSDPFLTQNLFKSLQQLSLSILSLSTMYMLYGTLGARLCAASSAENCRRLPIRASYMAPLLSAVRLNI